MRPRLVFPAALAVTLLLACGREAPPPAETDADLNAKARTVIPAVSER